MRRQVLFGGRDPVDGPGSPSVFRFPGMDLEPAHPGEHLRIGYPANLPEVQLLVGYPSGRYWQVFHESYDICVAPPQWKDLPGSAHWRYRGASHVITTGVALTEPGELHVNTKVDAPGRFWVMMVPPSLVESYGVELRLGPRPHFCRVVSESDQLSRRFMTLFDHFHNNSSRLQLQTMLAYCIKTLFDTCGETKSKEPSNRHHPRVQRAREYLHEHWAESVTLDDLVTVSGLSRYHLVRSFAKSIGVPPHEYQNRIRIAAACRQIRMGIPPALVNVGFFDQSHLTYHFKRMMGITPGQFRRLTGVTHRSNNFLDETGSPAFS